MEVVGTGYEFGHADDYDRTLKEMGNATLLYDDVTGYEFEEFVKKIKPDLIGSGIKEKYIFQKMGIPFRQMHSWDYSGPYHGYDGFAIFARDMDMTLNNPCWSHIRPPWKKLTASRPRARRFKSAGTHYGRLPNMSQQVDDIKPSFPLFRDDEYKDNLARKKELYEEAHDAAKIKEVFEWTTTEEYKELNFKREALTINPAKACQPLGAVLCALGFEKTMPYVHGSQGCVAYFRTYFNRHFKEPISCVSDSMTEDAAVFGGQKNMFAGLENAKAIYQPEMIAVSTTCMAEVIGDDLNAFINNAKTEQPHSSKISRRRSRTRRASSAATSPAGTTCSRGFSATSPSTRWPTRRSAPTARSTSFPGFETYLGNFRVIKRMLNEMDVPFTFLSDPEEVLDTPADGQFRMYAGGTTQDEVKDAPNALTTVLLQPWQLEKSAKYIENTWAHEIPDHADPDGFGMDRPVLDEDFRDHRQADPGVA